MGEPLRTMFDNFKYYSAMNVLFPAAYTFKKHEKSSPKIINNNIHLYSALSSYELKGASQWLEKKKHDRYTRYKAK